MPSCPSCRRPVAVARASCLYCGAPLAPDDVAAIAAVPSPPPPEAAARGLVILDLDGAAAGTLGPALGLPLYEARLLARRGGLHLHRVLDAAAAAAEASRLAGLGLPALVVPEAEARARPLRALSGRRTPEGLSLGTEEGPLDLALGEIFLIVTGPIARQRQSRLEKKRAAPARLDEGRRVHLHRRGETRAIEIDPDHFEPRGGGRGSARLEVDAWVADFASRVPHDEEFHREPPALAPSEPEPPGPLAAAASLGSRRRRGGRIGAAEEEPALLDNVAQFRFFSAWRAAVARRRAAASTC
jgi:hypothetical protein